jgi:hypothetical protein
VEQRDADLVPLRARVVRAATEDERAAAQVCDVVFYKQLAWTVLCWQLNHHV